jgi:ABC-type transport system involved in multi-copper enzyme maturation permease subunit
MKGVLGALLRKEARQITRSRRTVGAAALVPALMLIFVATGDILVLRLGFGSKPVYLLSAARAVSPTFLLRHFSLPVLVTISSLVTPSIVMGDVLFGERERRTLELLVALPVSAFQVVLAKLIAVLTFAVCVTVPLFALNVLIVTVFGYSSPSQTASLALLMFAAIGYSAASALLITLLAGEPRAANILSGLILGPVVPLEGAILGATRAQSAIVASGVVLALIALVFLFWSSKLLSFERLFGT